MKTKQFGIILVFILILGLVSSASAQSYYFKLTEETVHAYWDDDGSLTLDYTLVFENQPGAHSIDYVDMGMPNDKFGMNSVSAQVNGQAVEVDQYAYEGSGSGFAVVLGARAIPPGQSGTVNVKVEKIGGVLYKASEPADYASAVFSPNWFGSEYMTGNTRLTMVFHLPPGVQPDQPRYFPPEGGWPGLPEPTYGYDPEGRITYTWVSNAANGYTQYKFGAAFPISYVPEESIVSPSFLEMLGISEDAIFGCLVFLCFGFFVIGLPAIGVVSNRKRKMKYLPPKITIEGHGIKRGLTAVEAAVLMEQPLDKVLQMVLFGALKKAAVEVTQKNPLKIRALSDPLPESLRGYEKEFVGAMLLDNKAQIRKGLQDMMVNLVKSLTEKMKGFSRKETLAYYKSIMEQAWRQIEAAETPEVKSQLFDEALEWTMLDKDYDERTRKTFTGPVYIPTWWGRYEPISGGAGKVSAPAQGSFGPMGSGSRNALPGADFAASMVSGVENFAGNVIGNVRDFTGNVTKVTNPPPVASTSGGGYSGRSGGGGSSCACACACAGCACACAGGGR